MDKEQALVIKTWRVELGCSWRRVAELAAIVWPGKYQSGDQMDGKMLCNEAADALNEDSSIEPWN
jgi:hypothetical protein